MTIPEATNHQERAQLWAHQFLTMRPRLMRIAYAILGSRSEAEDVVSDVWLKLATADAREPIRDVEAWSTVAVGRSALDAYRSARYRRETYVGPWLPEPDVTDAVTDPADHVTLADTVSFALLVVLESLSPAERTAWVLHDLFGWPFPEVATVVGRTPQAVRQLAARARAHLARRAPRVAVAPADHRAVVEKFVRAAAGGDISALLQVLDPHVVLTSDGGGVVSAARRPVHGADRVARFLLGVAAKQPAGTAIRIVDVNGTAGLGMFDGPRLTGVLAFRVVAGRIDELALVRAPAKLHPPNP